MAPLKSTTKFTFHTFISAMCARLMSSTVFWPGLSVCQGCFMSLSWCCYHSEECQFTFLECHFITFISVLLSPCQTSQGSVQFKFPQPHKAHKLKCWYSFLSSVSLSLSRSCQIITHLLHSQSHWQRISAGVLLQETT